MFLLGIVSKFHFCRKRERKNNKTNQAAAGTDVFKRTNHLAPFSYKYSAHDWPPASWRSSRSRQRSGTHRWSCFLFNFYFFSLLWQDVQRQTDRLRPPHFPSPQCRRCHLWLMTHCYYFCVETLICKHETCANPVDWFAAAAGCENSLAWPDSFVKAVVVFVCLFLVIGHHDLEWFHISMCHGPNCCS